MNETIRIIVLIISIVAGALCIVFSNQLTRKYPVNFLNSYFYYLLFLYIFGVYSLIGSGAANYYIGLYNGSEHITIFIELFLLMLGTPFLILFSYMLIRISFEISQKILPGWFTLVYFIVSLVLMAAYAFFCIRIINSYPLYYDIFKIWQKLVFSAILISVHIFGFIFILIHVRSRLDQNERRAIRIFAFLLALFPIISIALLLNTTRLDFLKYIFIFFFLSIHLITILFHFLYFDKYYVDISSGKETIRDLSVFVKAYDISRRETDIIELICRGKTNQEISDSLFISVQTVKDHIHRIFLKTGVKNRVQLINLIRSGD